MTRSARDQQFWDLHDFSVGRGLEIGPLHAPLVLRSEADVHYVDVHDRDGLIAHYETHPNVKPDRIPEIDYVLIQDDGRVLSLPEAAKAGAPFAWAVASHVIEHVPDVIGWLEEVAELVEDDGALVLAVPDRRYCFDVHRPPTTVGQMLEAHERGDTRPPTRAVYDSFRSGVEYDVQDLWDGVIPGYAARTRTAEQVLEQVETARSGTYVDSHVWLFTPDGFVQQLHELRLLGEVPWYVEQIVPTPPGKLEFGVRLRRLPRSASPTDPVAGEVLSELDMPDWVVESTRGRRTPDETGAELKELRAEVARLRARLKKRRRRIEAQQRRIEEMERSRRWRVGGALLNPLRALRRPGPTRTRH